MRWALRALALAALAAAPAAHAHKASDAYLALSVRGSHARGQWDIALRDLELAVGLDANADGRISWGELRAQRAAVAAYASSHLGVRAGGAACGLSVTDLLADAHSDGAYAVLMLALDCPSSGLLSIDYDLLFALDPQHRGLLRVERGGAVTTAVLSPARPRFTLAAEPSAWHALADFAGEGVWHIWLGFDHVLFLLCLLLPAAIRRESGRWQAVASSRAAALEMLRVVSAFTLAHSLTLGLGALGFVALPSRWVESAIAASIVLTALDNVRPFLPARRAAIAFGFGLVHGLGFASVLAALGLPSGARALALLGFNLGVELGQLAIVAGCLPLALALRRSRRYQRLALAGGSLAITLVASVWLWQRALGA